MEKTEMVKSVIRQAIKDANLKFDTSPDGNIFILSFSIDSQISSVRLFINATNLGFTIVSIPPFQGDVNNRNVMYELAALATRINYKIRLFKFSMDFSDGELRCELDLPVEGDAQLSPVTVTEYIMLTLKMWESYGACFLGVLFGGKTAEDAFNDAK